MQSTLHARERGRQADELTAEREAARRAEQDHEAAIAAALASARPAHVSNPMLCLPCLLPPQPMYILGPADLVGFAVIAPGLPQSCRQQCLNSASSNAACMTQSLAGTRFVNCFRLGAELWPTQGGLVFMTTIKTAYPCTKISNRI